TSFNKAKSGFDIVIVDTGGNHADLTEDYASIPTEMKAIAQKFGKKVCREFKMEQLVANIESLRETVNDRAILRCLHFFNENRRVDDLADAIAEDDYDRFLKIIQASGDSSFKYLQNCYTTKNPLEQGISLALGLSEYFLQENNCRGACRVHGGGFAGTIQTFIDEYATQEYIEFIENIFGKNSATKIQIRDFGGIQIA
ncbi:MAG: galactokinase, partial [Candidatus Marinimicrobia bacterium]|nr:galactokinase [Candidatus Neomarinimicrobiota bacterium]